MKTPPEKHCQKINPSTGEKKRKALHCTKKTPHLLVQFTRRRFDRSAQCVDFRKAPSPLAFLPHRRRLLPTSGRTRPLHPRSRPRGLEFLPHGAHFLAALPLDVVFGTVVHQVGLVVVRVVVLLLDHVTVDALEARCATSVGAFVSMPGKGCARDEALGLRFGSPCPVLYNAFAQ